MRRAPLLALLCLPACAFAQAAVDMMLAREPECSLQRLGQPIEPAEVGEPVGGVLLDEISWYPEVGAGLCVVRGRLLPADLSASGIPDEFAVSLPALWNRRSLHALGGDAAPLLAQGFAVYGSEAAPQRRKGLHDVAQLLIERMFREQPRYRYLLVRSLDGMEVLRLAQRHPRDYDGIAVDDAQWPASEAGQARIDLSAFREHNGHLVLLAPRPPASALAGLVGRRQLDATARIYVKPPPAEPVAFSRLLLLMQKWVEESRAPPPTWGNDAD